MTTRPTACCRGPSARPIDFCNRLPGLTPSTNRGHAFDVYLPVLTGETIRPTDGVIASS